MKADFPSLLQRYVADAFGASWEAFAITTTACPRPRHHRFSDEALAAVIGIRGDGILGTLTVAAEDLLLKSRHPMGAAVTDQLARDLLGEVANLTVGAFNAKLGEDGHVVKISPPSVEAGALVVLHRYARMKPSQRFWLAVGEELVVCQLSADLEPGLVLGQSA
jgi:CheY-specific phosphatase CheX